MSKDKENTVLIDESGKASVTLIAGPTASGKSALAIRLAEEQDGVIVNADSMQAYRELSILTARPGTEEEARVPHRLYGHRSAAKPYSVGLWLDEVAPLIAEARAGGAPLIITGGTGLYFKALLEGISVIPDIPDDIRAYWRAEAKERGAAELHAILSERDPVMGARLQPNDLQRIVRALEVQEATGVSIAELQQTRGAPLLADSDVKKLYVSPPREVLYERCNARLDVMVRAGALEEVTRLAALKLDPAMPAMRAIGVRTFLAHLAGEVDFDTAITLVKTETRQYAKRQLTWARRNMITWNYSCK
jgi:tRNA dimethylallyltransferase